MKSLIATAAACALLVFSPTPASAQTRTRRSVSTAQKRRSAASPADAARTNAVRLQLATLSKDMTRFLYIYGRLSKDLEITGAQAESSDVASRTRAGLIENVRAMRDRLDQLESQFRFTQGLERQYQTIQGVSTRADQAAQLVSAGRYDQAGRALLEIAAQLTDVLVEMQ